MVAAKDLIFIFPDVMNIRKESDSSMAEAVFEGGGSKTW
jgi:hypothetical protein